MKKIKAWYNGLSDQWRATLRTFFQTVLGSISIVVVGALFSVTNILNGNDVDLAEDMSNYGRLALLGLVGGASALWSFIMNRNGVVASYNAPSEVEE